MRPDFDTCGAEFLNNSAGIFSKYVYNGTVRGILASARPVLITVEGCRELCGRGIDYYSYVILLRLSLLLTDIHVPGRTLAVP